MSTFQPLIEAIHRYWRGHPITILVLVTIAFIIAIGVGVASADKIPVEGRGDPLPNCAKLATVSVAQDPPPILCQALMKNRTRWRMSEWCKKMEKDSIVEIGVVMMDCDTNPDGGVSWGVDTDEKGARCFYYSVNNPRYGYCYGWMRVYDRFRNADLFCEGKVSSWIYTDPASPTGWFLSSRLSNRSCFYGEPA